MEYTLRFDSWNYMQQPSMLEVAIPTWTVDIGEGAQRRMASDETNHRQHWSLYRFLALKKNV